MLETGLRVDAVAAAPPLTLFPSRRSVNGAPRWAQWVVGLGVPSAFTVVVAVASAQPPGAGHGRLATWLMPRVLLAPASPGR